MDEDVAGNAADAIGLTEALGFRPSHICVPLDANSLSASWTRMATASRMAGDCIEVLLVDDADAVPVDVIYLRRALARASRDDHPGPDPDIVRGMLEPTEPACTDYALPHRFDAKMRLRMSTEILASGDPYDYVTDIDTRCAVAHAAMGIKTLIAKEMPLRAALMLTGIAAYVWSQATRTDLSPDIIRVSAHYVPETLHTKMALMLYDDAMGENADREAYLCMQNTFAEGLDELANLLAAHRATRLDARDSTTCFCGSGIPYINCCMNKSLDEIARDW